LGLILICFGVGSESGCWTYGGSTGLDSAFGAAFVGAGVDGHFGFGVRFWGWVLGLVVVCCGCFY